MKIRNRGPRIANVDLMMPEIKRILKNAELDDGKYNRKLEEAIAAHDNVRFAVSCGSGGDALLIMMEALRDKYGYKNAIVPDNTHMATFEAAYRAFKHVTVVPCGKNGLILEDSLLKYVQVDDLVIFVGVGGQFPESWFETSKKIALKGAGCMVDGSHSMGSYCKNFTSVAQVGHGATYSLYGTKLVVAGEGGLIVTDDRDLERTLRRRTDLGKAAKTFDNFVEHGYSSRFSNLNAYLALMQVFNLRDDCKRREDVALFYKEACCKSKLKMLFASGLNNYKCIVVFNSVDLRVRFERYMINRGIELGSKVFPVPLSQQPIAKQCAIFLGINGGKQFADLHVCLPSYVGIADSEVKDVVEAILEYKI